MNSKRTSFLTRNSQNLRRNMTKEEKHLWYDFLKKSDYSIKRQKVIGNYIADFCVPCASLIIEIDGAQHGEVENKEYDKQRDTFLSSLGYKVLRYTNIDIHQSFDGVCVDILKNIENRTPHQSATADSFPSKGKP